MPEEPPEWPPEAQASLPPAQCCPAARPVPGSIPRESQRQRAATEARQYGASGETFHEFLSTERNLATGDSRRISTTGICKTTNSTSACGKLITVSANNVRQGISTIEQNASVQRAQPSALSLPRTLKIHSTQSSPAPASKASFRTHEWARPPISPLNKCSTAQSPAISTT